MLIYLILIIFFLVCGIQLLRGKFQWLIPEESEQRQQGRLGKKGSDRASKSRAVGILFVFCAVCILGVALGSILQEGWISRIVAAVMLLVMVISVIAIASSNKFKK